MANNSWRPSNICPICSNPHLPFCPPPPPPYNHQYFPNQFPPQLNPNYNFSPNPIPRPPPFVSVSDDERRLRLIRDHGAPATTTTTTSVPNYSCNNTYSFIPNHSNNQTSFSYSGLKRKFEQPPNNNNVQFRPFVASSNQTSDYRNPGVSLRRYVPVETQNVNAGFPISHHYVPEPTFFNGQPPLPNSPPPPLPAELPGFRLGGPIGSSSSYNVVNTSVSMNYSSKPYPNSTSYNEEIQAVKASSNSPVGGMEGFRVRHPAVDKPKVIDASLILKHPHRSSRPDHVVVILRGLPGSGKSYLAKFLRDLEVENGGKAPRIHSMDDYFMTEVEKVEERESSGSARGKKPVVKIVMEYCYEPEMEEAYRSSMLKAFKKTLDEGVFSFVIVDDRNLRVADFAQFWATAKRSGYEVYVLEATYKDPAGCAARNVHGFTLADIQNMANQWEETPSLYMKLDIKSVLHGDDLEENGIEEVDMDTEDDQIGALAGSEDANFDKVTRPSQGDDGVSNGENKWNAVEEHPVVAVKELGKSKWSTDLDEDYIQKTELITGKSSGLSGLIKSHGKKGKPVRWADQVGKIGFSISAGKATNVSLVIGPGSGYNLRSNPLPDEEKLAQRSGEPRRRNIFQEQLRAECESFKAVFDKRKQRISGLHLDDD